MSKYFGFAQELLDKGLARPTGVYEQVELYDLLVQTTDDRDFYLSLAEKKGGSVLDLACGSGRLLKPLAELGLEVVGLDLSRAMLDLARQNLGENKNVHLIQGDMRSFSLGVKFNTIIIPYFSLIYMLTDAERKSVFQQCWKHLHEGGLLAFDFLTGEIEEGEHWPALALQGIHPISGEVLISVVQIKGLAGNLRQLNQINYCLKPAAQTYEITVQASKEALVSADRMEKLVSDCNFSIEGVYGGYLREKYTGGEECVIVARKC
ncbi:MAG TPA: class I SAM-dependent methyltransferase [Firmicutes bacterium]|nr:class I SAM-dependent methyltransferase [Bacillota bacterium]